MSYTSLMFDLDGTLTDSLPGIENCFKHALSELDYDLTAIKDWRWIAGPPLKDSFSRLLPPDKVATAIELYRERFSAVGWQENSLFPGVHELLTKLIEHNRKLYIVSSKPEIFVRKIALHFNISGYFNEIHGADLHGGRQHKPELIALALKQHNIQPERAVMIGDREMDISGAKANHIASIGAAYGYGGTGELEAAGADKIAASVSELLNILL